MYHLLPPGGADRALYELTRRTQADFHYILYRVELGPRDPFHGADRSPIEAVVDEVKPFFARSGGETRLGQWTRTIPAVLRAERRIAAEMAADGVEAVVAHHQRFLQAPSILAKISIPSIYMMQEPRRRSFEYALSHANEARSFMRRLTGLAPAALDQWARRYDIRTTRCADHLLTNSEHTREYAWRAYGRDAEVLAMGVDEQLFTIPCDGHRDNEVLAIGTLDSTKDHELAIRAVASIDAAIRPRLRIIHNRAAAGMLDSLNRLAQELGVNLYINSAIPDSELVIRYQRALALVATGRVEPLGLTPLEAAACGTPSVAVREGGYRETVIDGITGYLTDRNPLKLGKAIVDTINGRLDATRSEIRHRALEHHSWEQAAATYRRAVHRSLDNHGAEA